MQESWIMNEPFTYSEVADFITECIWLGIGIPTEDELVEFCNIGKSFAKLIINELKTRTV